MKKNFKKIKLAGALAALGLLSAMGTAQATIFEIDFNTLGAFSGTAPGSPSPSTIFATAVFDDHGGSGSVTLTMSVLTNLPSGSYVNDWYFNVSSAPLGVGAINFVSGVAASVDNGSNAFKADGTGGKFDLAFSFSNGDGELAPGPNHNSVYKITGSGLTASSFNSLSVPDPNGGNYLSAIHLQGYGNSVWVAGNGIFRVPQTPADIPEPATLALLGLGLFGLAATRRRPN